LLKGSRTKLKRFLRENRPGRFFFVIPALALLPFVKVLQSLKKRTNNNNRIILFQRGGIGDLLMLTPVIRILLKRFPKGKVDLCLTHDYVKDAFECHPYISEIIPFDFYWKGYRAFFSLKSRKEGIWKILFYHPKLFFKVALKKYDLAIDYTLSPEMKNLSNALACSIFITKRIGYRENALGFLTDTIDVKPQKLHRVDYYFSVLQLIGINPNELDIKKYVYPLSSDDKEWAKSFLKNHVSSDFFLLAIHPGGANLLVTRRWPLENFITVGKWVIKNSRGTVILIGGKEDIEVCDAIASELKSGCINICNQTTLKQTAAILSFCNACLTNDTGILHLAAAVGVPNIFAIFGPTDADLLLPPEANVIALKSDLECAPCAGSIINKETKECSNIQKGKCLLDINPEQVIKHLEHLLDNEKQL
jgi:heptosyltransferase II